VLHVPTNPRTNASIPGASVPPVQRNPVPPGLLIQRVISLGSQARRSPGSWVINGRVHQDAQGHVLYVHPDPRLPPGARRFWNSVGLDGGDPADGGVVVWRRGRKTTGGRRSPGQPVGFCRYTLGCYLTLDTTRSLTMAGTWIDRRYRNLGLGVAMWSKVLTQLPDRAEVHAVTTSAGGDRLVVALQTQFPNLDFHRYQGCRFPDEW
jgi:hypothetical protein